MRFLNLEMTAPNIDDVKIELGEGVNIISIPDKKLFDLFKYVPLINLYGSQQKELSQDLKEISSTINIFSSTLGREISFINNNGEVTIKDDKNFKKEDEQYIKDFKNVYPYENFIISSYYYPELKFNNIDPASYSCKIKQLLINSEIAKLKYPFFLQRKELLSSKEKKLIDLEREKQLLELKKRKKEKIFKEIQISEKNISKLEKRRDSIIKYRTALNEIVQQINDRDDASSKINNLKKDIIELNEIKEKIKSIENIISERFAHFSSRKDEKLPDLELIQQSFNSFRDINQQIDNFFNNRKKYSNSIIKIIFSSAIFSLIALMFLLFTTSASLILTFISAISAGITAITSIIYYITMKRSYPDELLEKKNQIENNLLEIFKQNDFPIDDYKTGELYEILFQYFDDFIDFRDMNSELVSLRKKISSSTNLEKEKKLEQLTNTIDELDESINHTIDNLDISIHPKFPQEEITKVAHNIDELLEENKTETAEKNSLIEKYKEEIDEYDKDEKNSLSTEMRLEETIKHINHLTDEVKHIKFLEDVFDEAVERWSKDKLEQLANNASEKITKIIGDSHTKEELSESFKNILIDSGKLKEEYMELKPYVSFAIMAALSEALDFTSMPPMFMIDPFIPNNEFSENMKKLLPEFFPDRQVIVIINYIDPNINGKLITL